MSISPDADNLHEDRPGSVRAGDLVEDPALARLGIESNVKRDIGLVSIVALGWNICNSWAAIAATMIFSIVSGGTVTLIYGILTIFVIGGSCAASMAEIASVYPTAGGQYHWTSILAPKKCSHILGYCCGAINVFGWLATTAGFVATTAQLITGIAVFLQPSYAVESWHIFLIYQLLNMVFFVYNMFLLKKTLWIHDVGAVLSLLTFIVTLVTCFARSSTKQSSSFVWTSFVNESGWSSDGVLFLIGLANPNFIYSGIDGAIHVAEECNNATKAVPKALMSTVFVGFVTSFAFAISMSYCTTEFDAVLTAPVPILEIWYQATHSKGAAVTFTILLAVGGCFATVACHQTASRLTYSFARDDAVVFSRQLSAISNTYGVPMYALLVNGIVVSIIGCVYLGSSNAFNALVSVGLILQQVSFAFPAALLMLRKRSVRFLPEDRPFKLGLFGWIANGLTIVLALVALIFYCFPPQLPVTGGNMNYACAVLAVMSIFAAVNWFGYASTHYHGPRMEDLDES